MPASLTRIFVMIRCKFLLEGVKKKKRFHLLKSNEFLKPKSGGLDIVKFQVMNPPLLGYWCLSFGDEGEVLWRLSLRESLGLMLLVFGE